jgi:hypothetical protein
MVGFILFSLETLASIWVLLVREALILLILGILKKLLLLPLLVLSVEIRAFR